MAASRFRDAWLKQQFYADPDRFTVETPPDPEHGSTAELPEAVKMIDAPISQGGGEIYSDVQWENHGRVSRSQRIDTTPVEGAGTGADRGRGYGGVYSFESAPENYGRGKLGASRGRDLGADKRQTSQFGRPYRFYNEQWFGIDTEGFNPPPITHGEGDDVLRRGLNAYPENDGSGNRSRGDGTSSWTVNMPSWKRGNYHLTNVQRDFNPPNRTHDNVRMVRPDIVTIVGDAPPPDEPDKYHSPFSSLRKFMPKARKIGGVRRTPGPWDEAQVATAAAPTTAPPTADGMVVP